MSEAAPSASGPIHETVPTESIEGFKGIIVAFMMALVFRAFIIEGFEIPTGSMAPTLMGQHTLVHGTTSGATWPVGPDPRPGTLGGVQNFDTLDPMTLAGARVSEASLRSGDRVFILKYLFPLYTPSRYDVVVFKNPTDPSMNYIKRLVGLGPEEVAIVDGDVFSRPLAADAKPEPTSTNTWSLAGWSIDRKPESAQRAMWQHVFDTRFTPLNAVKDSRVWFRSPWTPDEATAAKWQIENRREYRYEGTAPTSLTWDLKRHPISDYYAYNARSPMPNGIFPVSDVRTSLTIRPETSGGSISFTLASRGHQFRASIKDRQVTIEMKPDGAEAWKSLASGSLEHGLTSGEMIDLEFWHSDQRISLFASGRPIAHGDYDWTPTERLANTMGVSVDELFATTDRNLLLDASKISQPRVSLEFGGGPFTIISLALDRDIHYQANNYTDPNHPRKGQPAAATHPRQPLYLSDGEYFMCGDNSPASLDGRLWDKPYPWVASDDPKYSVVTRDAMIGRAFVVYWPGMYWKWNVLPVPDFGRVRQIR